MGNRLFKFRAKGEEFDIDGDKLELKSLTFPELTEFAELVEKGNIKGALNHMLFVTLRKAISTEGEGSMTDDEIRSEVTHMDSKVALKIIEKVKEMSNLPRGDEPKKKDLVKKD